MRFNIVTHSFPTHKKAGNDAKSGAWIDICDLEHYTFHLPLLTSHFLLLALFAPGLVGEGEAELLDGALADGHREIVDGARNEIERGRGRDNDSAGLGEGGHVA